MRAGQEAAEAKGTGKKAGTLGKRKAKAMLSIQPAESLLALATCAASSSPMPTTPTTPEQAPDPLPVDGAALERQKVRRAAAANGMTDAELATVDPKRARRIKANRLSAARSKERKTRHVAELEAAVVALQHQAAQMSVPWLLAECTRRERERDALIAQIRSLEREAAAKRKAEAALRRELKRHQLAVGAR